jgi:hypothetical protein
MYNLFVTYDLKSADEEDYKRVEAAIKALGTVAWQQYSVWYVRTQYTGEQVRNWLMKYVKNTDRVLVIEARNAWGHNTANWSFVCAQWAA